jgi:hypothetical protein
LGLEFRDKVLKIPGLRSQGSGERVQGLTSIGVRVKPVSTSHVTLKTLLLLAERSFGRAAIGQQ